MRHQFFIQQFDLSFLQVSKHDYFVYLKRCRDYSSLKHEVDYGYIPGIKGSFIEPTVNHFLCINHSWL